MVLEFPSNQQPRIEALAWDKDNDSLAILTVSFKNLNVLGNQCDLCLVNGFEKVLRY